MPRRLTTKPIRMLSLGWGVQTFTYACMVALNEEPPLDYAVFADTRHESSKTYAFIEKWQPWLEEHGIRVVTVRANNTDVVIRKWSNATMIPAFTFNTKGEEGQTNRQCTNNWKIRPIRTFARSLLPKTPPVGAVEMVLGISWDEALRIRDSDVRYISNSYPLVEQRITRAQSILWLEAHNLEVPPKSACVFCPYHSRRIWQEMKREDGSDWQRAVAADREVRDKRPDFQLFVHPVRKPLELAVRIPEDEGARQMSLIEQSCDSGYCFT